MGQRKSSESAWGIEPYSDVLSLKHSDSTVRKTISMLFQDFDELLKLTSCVWVLVFNIVRKLRLMTTYRKKEKQHKNSSCKQHLMKLLKQSLTHSVHKKDQKTLWLNSNSFSYFSFRRGEHSSGRGYSKGGYCYPLDKSISSGWRNAFCYSYPHWSVGQRYPSFE